uniref:Uncharacterized protein n=1 Tax=Caenorhabditis tropicalis TaxID=1561998 RepID=A0A1I7TLD5_9PELO
MVTLEWTKHCDTDRSRKNVALGQACVQNEVPYQSTQFCFHGGTSCQKLLDQQHPYSVVIMDNINGRGTTLLIRCDTKCYVKIDCQKVDTSNNHFNGIGKEKQKLEQKQ